MRFTYELADYVEKLNGVIPCLLTETGNPKVLEKMERKARKDMRRIRNEDYEKVSFLTEKGKDAL